MKQEMKQPSVAELSERPKLNLMEKGQKGVSHIVFSRLGLVLLLLTLQILLLFSLFRWFAELLPHYLGASILFNACVMLYLLNSRIDPSAKITWLIIVALMPVVGGLLLWYTQSNVGNRTVKKRIARLMEETKESIPQDRAALARLKEENPNAAALAHYTSRGGCYPVYDHTAVTYFPSGEAKLEEVLKQLEQARHFIFMEYFIIREGKMWGEILEVLARKAAEGVEVRVMYDGTCEFSCLPRDYPKRLRKLGIKCKVFSPLTPLVSTHYNYRDHRKILIVDGHTAFTGGVNLGDEYINHTVRFGHWKDVAVMLRGEAAKSFTLMFLQMWNLDEKTPEFERFLRTEQDEPALSDGTAMKQSGSAGAARGFVLPYGDCPLDGQKEGERIYMDILNRAQRYVHIMTPYLILDGEMETALCFAAERGVDVSLILPGIPDKKIPYSLAKTHYARLLESGVRIYEYTPGFVHAKVFVSDDREAVVGTVNLDYRSLYHHFECAAYLYETDCTADIEDDFQRTKEKCRTVTKETIWDGYKRLKPVGIMMKAVAPLL